MTGTGKTEPKHMEPNITLTFTLSLSIPVTYNNIVIKIQS